MSARITAPSLSSASAVKAKRTSPVPDLSVEIDKECPIYLETYNDGNERCPRLKACRHLVCKACVERMYLTFNGRVRCPICRTCWLDVAAPQERPTTTTQVIRIVFPKIFQYVTSILTAILKR